jgi:hypothetical protein
MRLSDIKVGEQYVIKSLEDTLVSHLPYSVGDIITVTEIMPIQGNNILFRGDYRSWGVSHKDIEQLPIQYTHPMQEHLGKEVITSLGRGFVVSTGIHLDDLYLLVDFGDGFIGHKGGCSANHIQDTETCNWVHCNECTFLTEDDE